MEQVQIHTRIEPGKFSRILGAGGLQGPVLSSCRYWISRAAVLGEECGQWSQLAFGVAWRPSAAFHHGLVRPHQNHSASTINNACAKALKAGTHRFKDLLRLIGEQAEQKVFGFAETHPLIRDLTIYANFINQFHTHEPPHDQATRPHCASIRTP